jgi:hypothetical protein
MPLVLLTIYAVFLQQWSAHAQSITPQVVASSGAHATTSNVQLSWTVGEVAVTTLSGGGGLITQGFHQTYDIATLMDESPDGITVSVYPNPATDAINILLNGTFPPLTVALYDMSGKLMLTSQMRSEESQKGLAIHDLPAGVYMLHIFSFGDTVAHTYRIIKQ